MQVSPHYGPEPLLTFDGDPAAIAEPAVRQRRRLAAVLEALEPDQWNHDTRCEGWSVRDVVVHLSTTNQFWEFSTKAGLEGAPTQFLAEFDPVADPAAMVEDSDSSAEEMLAAYVDSTDRLTRLWESIDADGWTALAEAPPGHITVSAVTHHALWDSWIHERDILLPLGIDAVVEADEVTANLRYVAALGPMFKVGDHAGSFSVVGTEPDTAVTVEIDRTVRVHGTAGADGVFTLRGNSVELVEALSMRAPLHADLPADTTWMFSGLAEVFDTPAPQ
jgi:uncharacterized protein (TIGR03083 family)